MRLSTPSTGVMATVEEESEWCNWITWILAEVVDFCFGPKTRKAGLQDAKSGWKSLRQKVEMWEINKPKTFLPVAVNERDLEKGRWFPELWYGSEWHGLFYPIPIMSSLLTTVSDGKHAFSDSSYPSGRVRSSNTQHLNRRVRVSPGSTTARGSYLCMTLRLRVEC